MNYIIMPGIEKKKTAKAEYIIDVVATHFGITVEYLKAKGRQRKRIEARQICCYILARQTHLYISTIGLLFDQDHTTVLHAIKVINELRPLYPKIDEAILAIENKLLI